MERVNKTVKTILGAVEALNLEIPMLEAEEKRASFLLMDTILEALGSYMNIRDVGDFTWEPNENDKGIEHRSFGIEEEVSKDNVIA